ncbi:MAG: hypothetical protein N3E50_09290 [Candidatus Goldbacteria bacterium]|nr:hypothetical protein [Candidatus Goldiibacteriota bacterium]
MRYIRKKKYFFKNICVDGGGFISGIIFHPLQKDLVYLRTDMGGAYKRIALNKKWTCITDMFGKDESFYNGVLSIALVEKNSSQIYMMCGKYTDKKSPFGRLYFSNDYGETWQWSPLPFKVGSNEKGRGMGERLAVNPHDSRILFAGSFHDGLWKSINSGKTWERIKNFPSKDINFLLFDRSQENLLFVAAADGSIYVSKDCGLQWKKIRNTQSGMAYRADISGDNIVYFTFNDSKGPWGIEHGEVWRYNVKIDGWEKLNVPEGDGGFAGIAVSPVNPDCLLVSTICRDDRDEIFLSCDRGKTFKPLLKNSIFKSFAPYTKTIKPHWISDIKINPHNPKNVIWTTGYGIWETYDVFAEKVTWYFNDMGIEETVAMQIISPPEGKIRLVSAMGDIDGFLHERFDRSPSKRHTPIKKTTLALDYAGLKPEFLVKAYNSGRPYGAYSKNGGRTWIDFKTSPSGILAGGVKSIAVSSDANAIVWSPENTNVCFSLDNGNLWNKSKGNVPTGYWVISEKVLPGIFYIYEGKKGKLWKSIDFGRSFYVVNSKLPGNKVKPGNDGMIDYEIKCVYNIANDIWLAAGYDGLFYSNDGGISFNKIRSVKEAYRIGFGRPEKKESYPMIFIWGRISNEEGFFMSGNLAKTWVRINDEKNKFGWIHCITGDPKVLGRCYLATEGRGILYGEME